MFSVYNILFPKNNLSNYIRKDDLLIKLIKIKGFTNLEEVRKINELIIERKNEELDNLLMKGISKD